MLFWNYGGTIMGFVLRRVIVSATNSWEVFATAGAAAMRLTPRISGGRSFTNSSSQSTTRLPQQSIWYPSRGIVFGSALTLTPARTYTTADDETEEKSPTSDPVESSEVKDGPSIAVAVMNHEPAASDTMLPSNNLLASLAADNGHTLARDSPVIDISEHMISASERSSTGVSYPVLSPKDNIITNPEQNEVPQTTTSFRVSKALFWEAKDAIPGTPESYWSHTLYRGSINQRISKPTIHYCRSVQTMERVIQTYFKDSKAIGFDMEWKINVRGGTPKQNCSLIQIANEERIALFHIALYPTDDLVAPSFRKIMMDPNVLKLGVAIKGDCTRLKNNLGIESQGIFELSHLYRLLEQMKAKDFAKVSRVPVNLATQVQTHLHLPLYKGGDVRYSDWSKPLDINQISYAASDSYAAVQLFATMEMKRKALVPTPPRPHAAELNLPIEFPQGMKDVPENNLNPVEDEESIDGSDAIIELHTKGSYPASLDFSDSCQSLSSMPSSSRVER